jgi:hypothetical protein
MMIQPYGQPQLLTDHTDTTTKTTIDEWYYKVALRLSNASHENVGHARMFTRNNGELRCNLHLRMLNTDLDEIASTEGQQIADAVIQYVGDFMKTPKGRQVSEKANDRMFKAFDKSHAAFLAEHGIDATNEPPDTITTTMTMVHTTTNTGHVARLVVDDQFDPIAVAKVASMEFQAVGGFRLDVNRSSGLAFTVCRDDGTRLSVNTVMMLGETIELITTLLEPTLFEASLIADLEQCAAIALLKSDLGFRGPVEGGHQTSAFGW